MYVEILCEDTGKIETLSVMEEDFNSLGLVEMDPIPQYRAKSLDVLKPVLVSVLTDRMEEARREWYKS